MIKLIMTDIDGTLVPEGSAALNPEYFEVFRSLNARGITVAVASGRPGASVKNLFAPVLQELWVVSQNGCVIEHGDDLHVLRPIPRAWIRELWTDIAAAGEGDSIIETASEAYCPNEGTAMYQLAKNEYRFSINATGGWDQVPDSNYSMMTVFHPENGWDYVVRSGIEAKWKNRITLVCTGKHWVDCMMPGNSKGSALEFLTRQLGITAAETVAFGDNFNDIPMIQAAGVGYAVDSAAPEVQRSADHVIPGYQKDGVLQVLRHILETGKLPQADE